MKWPQLSESTVNTLINMQFQANTHLIIAEPFVCCFADPVRYYRVRKRDQALWHQQKSEAI